MIAGSGKLLAQGGSQGIFCNNLTISDGEVAAQPNLDYLWQGGCEGIWAYQDLTVKGGKLTANGGKAKRVSTGIMVGDTMTVSGGSVTAKAGTTTESGHAGTAGITTDNLYVKNNGEVIVTGGSGAGERNEGIAGEVWIESGAKLTATGSSYAIYETEATTNYVHTEVAGAGWTDTDGTAGQTAIAASSSAQNLRAYKKLQFPAAATTYTVETTILGDAHGTLSVDKTSAAEGDTVKITATPENGYELGTLTVWDAGKNNVTITDSNTFTMPASNALVRASFKRSERRVYVRATAGGAYRFDEDSQQYAASNGTVSKIVDTGSSVKLTVAPDSGYRFKGWYKGELNSSGVITGNDGTLVSSSASYTVTASEDVALHAVFEAVPTYTVTNDGHGTATADKTSGAEGEVVTLSYKANNYYQFDQWEVVYGGVTITYNDKYTFTIGTENVEIKAIFKTAPIKTELAVVKKSTVYAGEILVDGASQMTYLYSPDVAYTAVSMDCLGTALTGTVFADLVPEVPSGSGTAETGLAVSSAHQEDMDEAWTSAAAVAAQYYTGTAGSETNENLYDSNAVFKKNMDDAYALFLNDYQDMYGGSPEDYNAKSVRATLSISHRSDWAELDGVFTKVNIVTLNDELITVMYTKVNMSTSPTSYTVTASAAENGSVSVDKASAAAGETVTLTVTPDASYELDALTVTDAGGNAVTVTDNTFIMPAANVTVSATFKEAVRSLCLGTTAGGQYSVQIDEYPAQTVDHSSYNLTSAKGVTVTLVAMPDAGYTFTGWYQGIRNSSSGFVYTNNGTLVSASAEYSFTLEENTDLQAVFDAVPAAQKLGGKTQWLWGETIEFSSETATYEIYYNKVNMEPTSTMQPNNGSYTVDYEGWVAPQHNIRFVHDNGAYYLHIQPEDYDAETPETPIGIKYVSGEGTNASPYLFELIYAQAPAEDSLYYTASGEGQDHLIGSGLDAEFTVKRVTADETTFSLFIGIQMDGEDVDESNYEATEGSVILKLKEAYLDTLSLGSHILRVLFTDGFIDIPFTVSEKTAAAVPAVIPAVTPVPTAAPAYNLPRTGDTADLALWAGAILLGAAGLIALKKRKQK